MPQFVCPGCYRVLEFAGQGATRCPSCGWNGEAYLFNPAATVVQSAELALPDDATCIHHPRKKATAVCAGTGDYICSLCAVELDGQTFSTEYLNAAGKMKAGKAFQRELPRPDSQITLYLLLPFIPYVDFVAVPFAFLWLPHGFFLYAKCLRMRREDPLFSRLFGTGRAIILPILLSIYSLAWLVGAGFGIWGLAQYFKLFK